MKNALLLSSFLFVALSTAKATFANQDSEPEKAHAKIGLSYGIARSLDGTPHPMRGLYIIRQLGTKKIWGLGVNIEDAYGAYASNSFLFNVRLQQFQNIDVNLEIGLGVALSKLPSSGWLTQSGLRVGAPMFNEHFMFEVFYFIKGIDKGDSFLNYGATIGLRY